MKPSLKRIKQKQKVTPPSIDENDINRIVLNSLAPLEDKIDLYYLQRRQAEETDDVQFAIAQAQEEVSWKSY
jgi:aryl-alcohol dehydrogenase-like predicted oxidoreductase